MKLLKRTLMSVIMVLGIFMILPGSATVVKAEEIERTLEVKDGSDITETLRAVLDINRYDQNSHLTVTIPEGSYKISEQLRIHSNTTLIMEGVTLTRTGNSTMLRMARKADLDATGGAYGYDGFKNIDFVGGTWDGGGKSYAIMTFGHAQNLTFTNVTFTNVKNSHHVEVAACKDVLFSGCTFSDFVGSWSSSQNYEAVQFDIMHSSTHFTAYPNYDDTPCKNITVDGCTFKHLQRGIGTHSAVVGSYFTNMQFTNNTFEDIYGYAISTANYKNSKINNNTMKDCGSGIIFRMMTQSRDNYYPSLDKKGKPKKGANCEIKDNKITVNYKGYKNVNFGISLYGANLTKKVKVPGSKPAEYIPKGDYRVTGVTVQGNTINFNCTGYALWLQGADSNTVTNNTITCNVKKGKSGTGDGIRLQGSSSNRIQNNTITNKKKTGKGKSMCGITIIESSNSNTVKGNTVTGASKYGISLKGAQKNKITSNTVESSGSYGISIMDKSNSGTVESNKVNKAGDNGIHIKACTKVKVASNTVKNCKGYGIYITQKSTVKSMKKNKLSKNKKGTTRYADGAKKI